MLLKFDNAKLFSDIIALVSELVSEVKIKVKQEGLEITAIDPASIAMVSLKIPKQAFSQFELEKEEELGINLDDLKQVLKRASQAIILEKQENKLQVKLSEKRIFSLALIAIEAEEKQIPKLNFNTKVKLKSKEFAEAIADSAIVADSCAFIASNNEFRIEAQGLNKVVTKLDATIEGTESKAKYAIDYLAKFAKASKFSESLILSFSTNYPARLDFKETSFELSFIIAPRVEEE